MIRFNCVYCEMRLLVHEKFAGEDKECPQCKRLVRVPAAGTAASSSAIEVNLPSSAKGRRKVPPAAPSSRMQVLPARQEPPSRQAPPELAPENLPEAFPVSMEAVPPAPKKPPGSAAADKPLQQAEAKRQAGDLDGAIRLLKVAFKAINNTKARYPVETFLTLPLYLQEAGKVDEAWKEYQNLLAKGYPNQVKDKSLLPADQAKVYEQMCSFLQMESKHKEAVKFGLFSYLSQAVALHRQKRKAELRAHIAKDNYKDLVKELLQNTGKEGFLESIGFVVEEQVKHLPNVDLNQVADRVDFLLFKMT